MIIDLTSGFGRRAGEAALAAQFRDSLKKKKLGLIRKQEQSFKLRVGLS